MIFRCLRYCLYYTCSSPSSSSVSADSASTTNNSDVSLVITTIAEHPQSIQIRELLHQYAQQSRFNRNNSQEHRPAWRFGGEDNEGFEELSDYCYRLEEALLNYSQLQSRSELPTEIASSVAVDDHLQTSTATAVVVAERATEDVSTGDDSKSFEF